MPPPCKRRCARQSHANIIPPPLVRAQSAQIYWQVADANTPDLPRVYPEAYRPHVVGMLWSTLAQMQTWFGAEAWKVYGIQVRCSLCAARGGGIGASKNRQVL